MELHPLTYDVAAGTWSGPLPEVDSERTLVLAIGARSDVAIDTLRRAFPESVVVGCGASNASMTDLTVTVARFDRARLSSVSVPSNFDVATTTQRVLRALAPHGRQDLRAVLVLGTNHGLDEVVVNLRAALPNVAIAAEQPEGVDVWVAGSADAPAGSVIAVGLYGESLQVPDPPESAPDLLLVTLGESTAGTEPEEKLAIRTTTYDLRTRSWSEPLPIELDSPRTLVLVFGSPEFAENRAPLFELSAAFPRSKVLGCSGAGEIVGGEVRDGILTVAVARFVHTEVILASADVRDAADSREAGHRLAAGLQCADLRVAFVLTEGPKVDGAELVAGLCEALPPDVQLAGGLAGDGSRFRKTWLLFDGELRSGRVVAAGLCGNHLVAGHGSRGGWEPFGPEHRVTRSAGAVVHELDGRPALDVYQEDLGTKAAELPGSALPFPLAVRKQGHDGLDEVLFRTLVSVDERERSLTFAGDVPAGSVATLMRAEWGRLVESAQDAAAATGASAAESDQLAIAVSGMGRRSVLGARTADEMLAVSGRLPRASIVGFYAYGELSAGQGRASLQNHTMTLTTLSESTVAVVGRVQSDGNRPAPTPAPAPPAAPRSVVVETFAHVPGAGWDTPASGQLDSERTVVFAVGGGPPHPELTRTLRRTYPRAHVLGWSSPGQTSLSVTVARFARTQVVTARVPVDDPARSYDAGRRLASGLQRQAAALRVVFVVGRAHEVRTAELTRGLIDALGPAVTVVGGLATHDDGRGWVVVGSDPASGEVAAVGLAGEYLAVGTAGRGGVDPYPPERVVTRAAGAVVYEIDHRPALSVLRAQLGPGADGPPTGQWFGLWVTGREPDDVHRVLAIDETHRTLTLDRPLPTDARIHLVRDTRAWHAAEARAAALGARSSVQLELPPALYVAIAGGVPGADGRIAPRDLSTLPAGAPVVGWTADAVTASGFELGPDGPVVVLALAESATPLPVPVAVDARNTPPRAPDAPPPAPRSAAASYTPTMPPTRAIAADEEPTAATTRPAVSTPVPSTERAAVVRGVDRTPAGVSRAADPADVARRTLGGVEVITVGARITEAFPGEKLGRELSGTVILDLGRVERITSFGVREWLGMLRTCRDRVDGLYLIRCTEPFVNQLTMIRGFAGHGHVVSFFAPYVCADCSTAYSALLDAERDRTDLDAMSAPKTYCPRCGGPGTFDDEEGSYFSVLGQLAESVPPQIRRAISAMDPVVAVDTVEKRVDGDVTRISVCVPTDGAVRWNQILDGSEGKLVLDFGRSPSATVEGAAALERAMRRIADDVDNVSLVAAPKLVVSRLLAAPDMPRLDVWSMLIDGQCRTCATGRTVVLDVAEHAKRMGRGEDPPLECPKCHELLDLEPSRALLRLVTFHGRPGDETAEIPRPPPGWVPESSEEPRQVTVIAPAAPDQGRGLVAAAMVGGSTAVIAVLLVLVLLAVGGWAGWVYWLEPQQRAAAAAAATVLPPVAAVPPGWTEIPVGVTPKGVRVVGQATAARTEEAGLARARDEAIGVLLAHLLEDLESEPIYPFVKLRISAQPGADDVERVARRFQQQLGPEAVFLRVDRFTRTTPLGVDVWAQYEISTTSYEQLRAFYGRSEVVLGARIGHWFPSLEAWMRNDEQVVVLSVDENPAKKAGILPVETIRSVNGVRVHTVDDVLEQVEASGRTIELEVVNHQAPRPVKITRGRSH